MKIFIVGVPFSGRTTVAKALCQEEGYQYIDASAWLKHTFRDRKEGEHIQQYQDDYHQYLTNRIKLNPWICIDNVYDTIKSYENVKPRIVIDSISSPKDFVHLFNINEDIVIFLNRTDNAEEFKDSESISVTVIRDYCFWLSSAGLLNKERWIEINFKIPGEEHSVVKTLGSKNTIYLTKSISKGIEVLKQLLHDMTPISAI